MILGGVGREAAYLKPQAEFIFESHEGIAADCVRGCQVRVTLDAEVEIVLQRTELKGGKKDLFVSWNKIERT